MNISIVMATYNGAKYIKTQLDSIVPYLKEQDELIISDDGSTDETIEIIRSYNYPNVFLVKGPHQGVVRNFESALLKAKGDILMFADQDDIWMSNKLTVIRETFEENPDVEVVLHDMFIADNYEIETLSYSKRSFEIRKRRHGVLYNLLYNGYYGCCMALKKEFINKCIPFPDGTKMYDQLLGLIAEYRRKSIFISEPLIIHRYHGVNLSSRQGFISSFKSKSTLLKCFCVKCLNLKEYVKIMCY